MVYGSFGQLFIAVAGASAALTGLLFVALSVSPRRVLVSGPRVIQQVRAAAALQAFSNALVVCLFGLVPGTNVGYPATVVGAFGVVFTAAAVRSIVSSSATRREQLGQLGLVVVLLVIFGTELAGGITLLAKHTSYGAVQSISYALVASLLVGVARAWELVGERGTGILASLALLTGLAAQADVTDPGQATGSTADDAQDNAADGQSCS
ncbi:MAG TPA: hypothetical protein VGS19_30950 [Streptosporangiaceae bacterium]|nr:hypothetical protein [Streptosporangiaceae bacterium]